MKANQSSKAKSILNINPNCIQGTNFQTSQHSLSILYFEIKFDI